MTASVVVENVRPLKAEETIGGEGTSWDSGEIETGYRRPRRLYYLCGLLCISLGMARNIAGLTGGLKK